MTANAFVFAIQSQIASAFSLRSYPGPIRSSPRQSEVAMLTHLRVSSALLLLFLSSSTRFAPANAQSASPITVSVNVPIGEWLDSYLAWAHRHPELMHRDKTSGSVDPMMMEMPYLEFFSPDGRPLYRGGNDAQNAIFLHSLQNATPSRALTQMSSEKPTLKEYLEMAKELKPYEQQLLTGKQSTIFAITYRNKALCKSQNEAMRQMKIHHPNIRIIEVALQM